MSFILIESISPAQISNKIQRQFDSIQPNIRQPPNQINSSVCLCLPFFLNLFLCSLSPFSRPVSFRIWAANFSSTSSNSTTIPPTHHNTFHNHRRRPPPPPHPHLRHPRPTMHPNNSNCITSSSRSLNNNKSPPHRPWSRNWSHPPPTPIPMSNSSDNNNNKCKSPLIQE